MDLLVSVKTIDLFIRMLRGDVKNLGTIEYIPQKPLYQPTAPPALLPRSTPEMEGLSSRDLAQFLRELSEADGINPHNLLVLRHGKAVLQASWAPYSPDLPHMMYSLSKSVTATAVGIAVQEGYLTLDDRISDIFQDKVNPLLPISNLRMKNVTIRHLLNMTAGANFNEAGSILEKDWIRGFMESDLAFEPGKQFSYNSLNSFMLGAAIVRKTGLSLTEYLTPRLFEPLGIQNVYWEKSPTGIEKGGWGLYLLIEDMAKLGQLYLQKGRWTVNGQERQLVSESWIAEASKPHITHPDECPDGYGYQIWRCPMEEAYQFNGVFGQYVIVMPKEDVVIALTCGADTLFPQGAALSLVEKYFTTPQRLHAEHRTKDFQGEQELSDTIRVLSCREKVPPLEKPSLQTKLAGVFQSFRAPQKAEPFQMTPPDLRYTEKSYQFEENSCSFLPLVLQAVFNNYAQGLSALSLSYDEDGLTLLCAEGQNINRLKVGFQTAKRSNIAFRQDFFTVATLGEWVTDEDKNDVLRLSVSFLEAPDTRLIKLCFYGDNLVLRMDESPRVPKAIRLVAKLLDKPNVNLTKQLDSLITQPNTRAGIRRLVTPSASGRDTLAPSQNDPWEGI